MGFAVLLSYMRFPGIILEQSQSPPRPMVEFIAEQIHVPVSAWTSYGSREQTRREHLVELKSTFGYKVFTPSRHYKAAFESLHELARQTDKGFVLAMALVSFLRSRQILLPGFTVLDRICARAATQATERIFASLTEQITDDQRRELDKLLAMRPEGKISILTWLREPPGAPNANNLLEHIERLKMMEAINLPTDVGRNVHQNRMLKLAREGGQMTPQHLRDLKPNRRYATLAAVLAEHRATVIDEIVDLHDRIIGKLFNRAKRNHEQEFQEAGKAINEQVRVFGRIGQALLEARERGDDAYKAIERVMPWTDFAKAVGMAQQLARGEDFDYLHRIGDGYAQVRRYSASFLEALDFTATPAARDVFDGVEALRAMQEQHQRKVPEGAPTDFVGKRWEKLVFGAEGVDRRYFELCAMSELKNALRSGDIWVAGSRQFKDFEEYLVPPERFQTLQKAQTLPLATPVNCERYLKERMTLLDQTLTKVDSLAKAGQLPDAVVDEAGLKITPLTNSVPDEVSGLMQKAYAMLPRVKITDLLMEVDEWTGFTRHFRHLKNGEEAPDNTLLLTAILADGINLGLTKMAEACPGVTYSKLSWLQSWHIRDETYSAALAELVNAQYRQPFAAHWGDGTTSSSDGQRFRSGGRAQAAGNVNPKYGSEPGVQFYTHISDQYAPFHTKVINVGVRDATHVLDGLLYHESDLRIEEHYTDTAGFTDHLFALMHFLGFRFAPRIRDLADRKLYVPNKQSSYPAIEALVGGPINDGHIRAQWDELLRLATSIKEGTVTASLILRKLGSYPRQNGLSQALRELGRIERTLFTLDWLQNVELRRRVNAGLNKGEAKNALARAVFFNRLGEVRDRSFEGQRYRASGLNLIVAAIILWNTVYLQRAIRALQADGKALDEELFQHLSPVGWEHINLTGDYVWRQNRMVEGGYRPLREHVPT